MNPLSWLAIAVVLGAFAYSAWRRAPLSLTLAVAIVVVFLLDYVSWYQPFGEPVSADLSWIVGRAYASPPWTFFTTIFVHSGAMHLIFNLLGFVLITPVLEDRIGSLRWAVLFLAGAAFGQILFWIVHAGDALFVLVGASGGLLAVFGAFARLYPRERVTLFVPIPGTPTVPVLWFAIGFLLLSFFMAATGPGRIAYEAHIGGLGFGLLFAPLVLRLPGKRERRLAAIDVAALEPLATTRESKAILEELRKADVPDVQAAWMEKFAAKAVCPECKKPLRHRRGTLVSDCGWRLRP